VKMPRIEHPKHAAPPLPPACWCGMPGNLTETKTHRRWHRVWNREWQKRQAPTDAEALARQWVSRVTAQS